MKVLKFDREEHGDTYTMLAQAARHGEARGIEQNRRVTKLLDKLDPIGESHIEQVMTPQGPREMEVWELVDDEATIILDDALHKELRERMEAVPWKATASRRVVAAYDFLDAAPTEVDGNGVNPEKRSEGD